MIIFAMLSSYENIKKSRPNTLPLRLIRYWIALVFETGVFIMKSGVYKIYWETQGYYYYGQAQHLNKRKSIHFARFRKGSHENQKMQRIFDKYGEPTFDVVEYAAINDLDSVEQKYIDAHFSNRKCCNMSPNATSQRGIKRSDQTCRKISEAKKGIILSGSHRSNISEGLLLSYSSGLRQKPNLFGEKNPFFGKTHTKEARLKMSEKRKGVMVGGKNGRARKVVDDSNGVVYSCIKEAAMITGIKSLSKKLNGTRKNNSNLRFL